jgi:hypothetical protein
MMMMRRMRSNYHALHVLSRAQPKLRKAIITNSRKELLNSIFECALNVLRGNVQLTACQKRKLQQHKAILRKVADKQVPLAAKRRVIVQRGGFLAPLLSAVLPVLAGLIFSRTKNT